MFLERKLLQLVWEIPLLFVAISYYWLPVVIETMYSSLTVGTNYKPLYKLYPLLPVLSRLLLVPDVVVSVLAVNASRLLNALIQMYVLLVLLIILPNVVLLFLLHVLLKLVILWDVSHLQDVHIVLLLVNPMIPALIGGVTQNLPTTSVNKRENPPLNSLHPVIRMKSSMNVKLWAIVVPLIPVRLLNVSNQIPKLLLTAESQK
jgi:hypothetical protein